MGLSEHYVTTTGTDTWANATNPATPASWATMLTSAVAGDRANVKVGTYSMGNNIDVFTNSGTTTSPIVIRGYSSTITDGYQGRTNGNGPLITTNMPLLSYTGGRMNASAKTFMLFESLQLTGAASNPEFNLGADSAIKSCVVSSSSTNAAGVAVTLSGARCVLFDSDVTMTGVSGGTAAVNITILNARVIGNRINGGATTGVRIFVSNATPVIAMNTIFTSTSNGITSIDVGIGSCILYNTIVSGSADGINIATGNTSLSTIIGNMITDNSGDGIDMVSTSNAAFTAYNRFRDNANVYANAGDWITSTSYGDVTTDTGGPETDYVAAGSNDYRLILASPAINAGSPLYAAIGALQRQQAASGGGMRLAGHGGLAA